MSEEPIQIIVDGAEFRVRFRAIQAGEEIPCVTPQGQKLDGWPVLIPLGRSLGGAPLTEEVLGAYLHAQLRACRDQTLERVEEMLARIPVTLPPQMAVSTGVSEEAAARKPVAAALEK